MTDDPNTDDLGVYVASLTPEEQREIATLAATEETQYPFGISRLCGVCGARVTTTGYAPEGEAVQDVTCSACGRVETVRMLIVGKAPHDDPGA